MTEETLNVEANHYFAKIVLNRRDFGINYARQDNPTFIGDNITVEIELVTRALDPK